MYKNLMQNRENSKEKHFFSGFGAADGLKMKILTWSLAEPSIT